LADYRLKTPLYSETKTIVTLSKLFCVGGLGFEFRHDCSL
jgi:hypothetical protein